MPNHACRLLMFMLTKKQGELNADKLCKPAADDTLHLKAWENMWTGKQASRQYLDKVKGALQCLRFGHAHRWIPKVGQIQVEPENPVVELLTPDDLLMQYRSQYPKKRQTWLIQFQPEKN